MIVVLSRIILQTLFLSIGKTHIPGKLEKFMHKYNPQTVYSCSVHLCVRHSVTINKRIILTCKQAKFYHSLNFEYILLIINIHYRACFYG